MLWYMLVGINFQNNLDIELNQWSFVWFDFGIFFSCCAINLPYFSSNWPIKRWCVLHESSKGGDNTWSGFNWVDKQVSILESSLIAISFGTVGIVVCTSMFKLSIEDVDFVSFVVDGVGEGVDEDDCNHGCCKTCWILNRWVGSTFNIPVNKSITISGIPLTLNAVNNSLIPCFPFFKRWNCASGSAGIL